MRQNKRFMLTALLALVAIMTLCFTLAACNAKEYSVNLQFEESQGNVELSPAAENGKYKEGTELTVTVTPKTGYVLDEFKLSTDSNAALDSNGKFVFTVSQDTTINVTFKPEQKQKYTLTLPQSVANGEIKVSPASSDNKYEVGTQLTITLEPASQYEVATFTVGGVDHKADLQDNKYSFAISGDTEIAATFSKIINRYTLTVPTVENGEIKVSPESADHKYDEGTQITITLEPAVGYEVSEFSVDNVDKKSELQDNVYSFSIEKETSINASFSKIQYNVTTEVKGVSEKGSISLAPQKSTYEYGDQVTVTVTVQAGHGVTPNSFNVSTDEEAVLNEEKTYTLTVSADTQIEVTIHEHECSEWSVVILAPTYHEGYCNICDEHYREFHYSMIYHSSNTEENEIYTCPKNCGYERKVPHDFEGEWTDDNDGNCHKQCQNESCNYVITKEHDIKWEKLPTESQGHVGSCNRCSYSVTEEHDTLGEDGRCSKCGYKAVEEHVCLENIVADANGFYDGTCQICGMNAIFDIDESGTITKFKDYSSLIKDGELKIKVPAKVNEIDVTGINTTKGEVFRQNEDITDIVISENVNYVTAAAYTFADCSKLKSVVVLASWTETKSTVFSNCSKLEYVVLPSTLTKMSSSTFGTSKTTTNLTYIYFLGTSADKESLGTISNGCSKATWLFFGDDPDTGWKWTDDSKEVPQANK